MAVETSHTRRLVDVQSCKVDLSIHRAESSDRIHRDP